MIFNSCVSMFSISFVSYYKVRNYIRERNSLKSIKETRVDVITVTCE
jgi:hypothetical protein